MSIYHDRHTILRSPKRPTLDEQLAGQPPMSQIQRVMAELGIESIPAYSPQAKGRIERLWGSLARSLDQGIAAGPHHNPGSGQCLLCPASSPATTSALPSQPPIPRSAWVPLPADLDLPYYFASRETRTVSADHCISFAGQHLQLCLAPGQVSLAEQTVSVRVNPEGEVHVYVGRQLVRHRPLADRPARSPKAAKEPPWTKLPADPAARTQRRAWLFGQG